MWKTASIVCTILSRVSKGITSTFLFLSSCSYSILCASLRALMCRLQGSLPYLILWNTVLRKIDPKDNLTVTVRFIQPTEHYIVHDGQQVEAIHASVCDGRSRSLSLIRLWTLHTRRQRNSKEANQG